MRSTFVLAVAYAATAFSIFAAPTTTQPKGPGGERGPYAREPLFDSNAARSHCNNSTIALSRQFLSHHD